MGGGKSMKMNQWTLFIISIMLGVVIMALPAAALGQNQATQRGQRGREQRGTVLTTPFILPMQQPDTVTDRCVAECIEDTFDATSNAPLAPLQEEAKKLCIQQCNQLRHKAGQLRDVQIRDARKMIMKNVTEAIRALHEKQKELREEFKDARAEIVEEIKKNGSTGEIREQMQEAQQELREKMDELREKKLEIIETIPEQVKKPRLIERGELINLNRALERSREKYAEAKEMHRETRKNIEETKRQYQECLKKSPDTTEQGTEKQEDIQRCTETKKEFNTDVRTFLLKTTEVVIESLNKLKYQIKMTEELSEEQVAAYLEQIEMRIIELKNVRVDIEDIKEDASREELKAATEAIRDAWTETNHLMKHAVNTLMVVKVKSIIQRMKLLEEKFVRAHDRLKERGADVTTLDEALSQFDETQREIQKSYEEATEQLAETGEGPDKVARKINELLKKIRADVKTAQQQLRTIVQEMKEQLHAVNDAEKENATAQPPEEIIEGDL